jgi:D-alanyl-lipoteichoic acid acyltransferase DltB (MBOAT superfamily)
MIYESKQNRFRKSFLAASIICNLGVLCFFKYYNFFLGSLNSLISEFGLNIEMLHLDIVLPVGISFYTFQVMSYTIDIYRKRCEPSRNFFDFALFVAFFPQLVAGPIERASRLLPQISSKRTIDIDRFKTGIWLIFWGLYKKIVIADNLAAISDQIFNQSATATCLTSYLGVLAFTIQIYCDFSGYTDIARGCARLLGFHLMRNFNLPFFATDPADYWNRWHISLSTWLRDYLYIPLGGNRKGKNRTYINLFITMTLGGLWHGASWNYIWWGIYHGILLIGHRIISEIRSTANDIKSSSIAIVVKIFIMFQFTLFGFIIFRSNRTVRDGLLIRDDSWNQILEFLNSYNNGFGFNAANMELLLNIIKFCFPLVFIQWIQFHSKNQYIMLDWQSSTAKVLLFAFLIFTWLIWGVQSGDTFIYFQF